MKNLKIGVTLGLKDNKESIWTNGIKQNVLKLVKTLKRSTQNYDVCILNAFDVDFSEKPDYLDGIDIHYANNKLMDMDLVIQMGASMYNSDIEKFKKSGDKKVVMYKCGNDYLINSQNILFKEEKTEYEFPNNIDEVWIVPQLEEANLGYYATLHRANTLVVPFIWHPRYLHKTLMEIQEGHAKGDYKKDYRYEVGKEKKIIGVMEPNLNLEKFCLIPAMIAEESYRSEVGRKHIECVRLTNAMKLRRNVQFMSHMKVFDLFKDNKITAEERYLTAFILTQHLDVVISHQMLLPLNYLYLDVAFMGYPILHNAPLCRDLGYYYDKSDTIGGAKLLNYILTEHDKNIDEYNDRNDRILTRYHGDNPDIVATYDMLIENLWRGGTKGMVYDPMTNLYK
jgi:hypothetical protein